MTNFRGGLSFLLVGSGGTGKSWFAGTAAERGAAKLIAFRPKEIDSYQYVQHGLNEDAVLINDPRWAPTMDSYEAGAYQKLMRTLWDLQDDDETDIVIFDPLTDVNEIIKREILKKERVGRVKEYSDGLSLWGEVRDRWMEVLNNMTALQYAEHPKHIIGIVHAKPPSEEEEGRQGIQFHGTSLPMLQGSVKYDITAEFQVVLHTRIERNFNQKLKRQEESYVVEVRANAERHNKIALAPALQERTLPNDFGSVMDAIEEASSARAS